MFKDLITYLNVNDIFRHINKDKICFTYSNASKTIQSRIDYILTSPFITNLATKCYVLNPPRIPDHKAVVLKLRKNIDIGKGYWKLNVKYLEDELYVSMITELIRDIRIQYGTYLNKRQLWDYCKLRIKEESIRWGIKQSKKYKTDISFIEEQINHIDSQINTTTDNNTLKLLSEERQKLTIQQNEFYTKKHMVLR